MNKVHDVESDFMHSSITDIILNHQINKKLCKIIAYQQQFASRHLVYDFLMC